MNNYLRYIGCFSTHMDDANHYFNFYSKLSVEERKHIDDKKNRCCLKHCNSRLRYNHFFIDGDEYFVMGGDCFIKKYPSLENFIKKKKKCVINIKINPFVYCKKCNELIFNRVTNERHFSNLNSQLCDTCHIINCRKNIRKKKEKLGKLYEKIINKSREEVLRIQYPNYYKQKDIYDKIDKINDLTTHQV